MNNLSDVLKGKQAELSGVIRIKEKWLQEGYIIVPNVFLLDKRISTQAKVIFLALCAHAMKKEYAFPSYEILSEEINLAKPQLIKYIKELEETGIVKVERTGRANNYEIIYSELDKRIRWVIDHLKEVKKRIEDRREK